MHFHLYFKERAMTAVSSKEYVSNEVKDFDLAKVEQIFVKRNNVMFIEKPKIEDHHLS